MRIELSVQRTVSLDWVSPSLLFTTTLCNVQIDRESKILSIPRIELSEQLLHRLGKPLLIMIVLYNFMQCANRQRIQNIMNITERTMNSIISLYYYID